MSVDCYEDPLESTHLRACMATKLLHLRTVTVGETQRSRVIILRTLHKKETHDKKKKDAQSLHVSRSSWSVKFRQSLVCSLSALCRTVDSPLLIPHHAFRKQCCGVNNKRQVIAYYRASPGARTRSKPFLRAKLYSNSIYAPCT